ncbi:MAG: galactose mutarotase [Lachnospiraceae bacterium]|nr:galactose mutarotase [Lachnospiraceae bacterium]
MIKVSEFGRMSNGSVVKSYTLSNENGMEVSILSLGALMQRVLVPDRDGVKRDVTLGFDDVLYYEKGINNFGSIIGRNANRIKNGSFVIDGKKYQMALNDGINNLHSGFYGYHLRLFTAEMLQEENAVRFMLMSPDGDQGFPGNAVITVTYTLTQENAIEIFYEAVSDKDTIMNLTNHAYWNLNGHAEGSIEKHLLKIDSTYYTPLLVNQTPDGSCRPVEGTPFDFREFKEIGRDINAGGDQLLFGNGYDHNFMINGKGMREHAVLKGEVSGISMTILSDLPAIQFYSGNGIDTKTPGKEGKYYQLRGGLALETQYVPDAMNLDGYKSPILKAGEKYETKTIFRFE